MMETPRIVPWRWEYLEKIEKLWAENNPIVYSDETWIDPHDNARIIWSNKTANITFQHYSLKETALWYALQEVVKGWYQILFYFVVSNLNHLLIIMTWMMRFCKGGLQLRWYLIYQKTEKF